MTCALIVSAQGTRSTVGSGCLKSPRMPSDIFNRFARSKPTLTFPRIKRQRQPFQNMTKRKAWVAARVLPALCAFCEALALVLGEKHQKRRYDQHHNRRNESPTYSRHIPSLQLDT